MAFPPGATVGNLAKLDDSVVTDAEVKRLNDAQMPFGGSVAVFTRMSGMCQPSIS